MGLVTQEDPIGLAGGLNLYGYAGGDPVNLSDPFGLCASDDVYYDICGREVARVENDSDDDRHFLVHEGEVYQLDCGLVEGDVPYGIFSEAALDWTAANMGSRAPAYGNRAFIALHSLPGGTLDFKQHLPSRALWHAGNGRLVHKHAVGNTAWGYYMAGRGYALQEALQGAWLQGFSVGGEDPLDQQMIRRGYGLHP